MAEREPNQFSSAVSGDGVPAQPARRIVAWAIPKATASMEDGRWHDVKLEHGTPFFRGRATTIVGYGIVNRLAELG